MPPAATAICSAGIFIGGSVWSYMYVRYESIWPGYLSHAIVDLCIFGIGAFMIFG
jgi:membrane protease YdiL (CAAX protease family)